MKLLINCPVKKKMIISFIIVIALTLIGSLAGILSLNNISNKSNWVYKYYGEAQGKVNDFETQFKNNQLLMSKILAADTATEKDAYLKILDESNIKMNETYSEMKELFLTKEGKEIIANLNTYDSEYQKLKTEFIKQAGAGNHTQANDILFNQIVPVGENTSKVIEELIQNKQVNGQKQMNNLDIIILISSIIILSLMLLSIIIAMFLAIKISNQISKAVKNMLHGMKSLSEGNLDIDVPVTSKDEIGILTAEFNETCSTLKTYVADINRAMALIAAGDLNVREEVRFKGDFLVMQDNILKMLDSQNELLHHINEASQQVYSSSEQVAGGSQSMAEGAGDQAQTVEELSSTVAEIVRQIDETAQNAETSSKQSNQAGELLSAANDKMAEMKKSMEEISRSSQEISKIISAIDDIASQTNLLALNASIEAARAGEAGKGFAVVADQVTVLAKQSADAAKESNELIAVSVAAVENGSSIADSMAESMILTLENALLAVKSVEKISDAAKVQSQAISDVSDGISRISNVVQENSSTAEECAAASEELSAQAEELRILVSTFKLRPQNL